jgi:CRISPR-associated endonuclease/helicase Cas3
MKDLESHRNKPLIDHLKGVREKSVKRGFPSDILEIASFFHDIGKCNLHFQHKLYGKNTGYSQHSYLSAYITSFLLMGSNVFNGKVDVQKACTDLVFHNILQNIIVSHHGNLRNIDAIVKEEPLREMVAFLGDAGSPFNIEQFLQKYYAPNATINLPREYYGEIFKPSVNIVDRWKPDSLNNFFSTVYNFAQLIEADKRDASDNKEYQLSNISKDIAVLDNNINLFLGNLSGDSALNKLRTAIRLDAEQRLCRFLLEEPDQRVFTLTSPTGSGKTFMMLKLANVIQQTKGEYGIIMGIPFTSIIDQTAQICSDTLLLKTLNYTSVANASQQMDELQKELEGHPSSKDAMKRLIDYSLIEESFDHPFVITTFVQLFQTLISNRNSTLLKLPNFTKRIFLIDEYQSLPANLYTFFCALLEEFCIRYDCYTILSTATMPSIKFNDKRTHVLGIKAEDVFKRFTSPREISDYQRFYRDPVFNRYSIKNVGRKRLSGLLEEVVSETQSTLVILNTVRDSLELFDRIPHANKYLLNKNFTIASRLRIIGEIKDKLRRGEYVFLVSTQLIEAGVDVDFPVVYRDIAPLPSLIQSAGRCNRNGSMPQLGRVMLFTLVDEDQWGEEVVRAEYIYNRYELEFVNSNFSFIYEEDLLSVQATYFQNQAGWKEIGRVGKGENLMEYIYTGQFEKLGEYRLIDDIEDEVSYFVGDAGLWDEFKQAYHNKPVDVKNFVAMRLYDTRLKGVRKKLSKYCVNVKIKPIEPNFSDEIMEVRNLADRRMYSEDRGIQVNIRVTDFNFNAM